MQHLYFLIPNLMTTKDMVHELKEAGVLLENVHVVAKNSEILKQSNLPEANLIQTSDLVNSIKRGATIGVVFSIILCCVYASVLPAVQSLSPLLLISIVVLGTAAGAWISSLIGISVDNPFVEKFAKYVKRGYFITVVDSHSEDENQKILAIGKHYDNVKCAVEEEYHGIFG